MNSSSIIKISCGSFLFRLLWLITHKNSWKTSSEKLIVENIRTALGRGVLFIAIDVLYNALQLLIGISYPQLAKSLLYNLWEYRHSRGIKYGKHDRQTLDIYHPAGSFLSPFPHVSFQRKSTMPRYPVVIFVHGGAWAFGHNWEYTLIGRSLSARGFLTLVINYRVYPKGDINCMLDDIELAVDWLVRHADILLADTTRIALSGHSAGAHICVQAAIRHAIRDTKVDILRMHTRASDKYSVMKENTSIEWGGEDLDNYLAKAESWSQKDSPNVSIVDTSTPNWLLDSRPLQYVKSIVAISGVYDIGSHYLFEANRGVHLISPMRPAMRGPLQFDRYSPILTLFHLRKSLKSMNALDAHRVYACLRKDLPFIYLVHGTDDRTVPFESSERLYNELRELSLPCRLQSIPKADHIQVMLDLMIPGSQFHSTLLFPFLSLESCTLQDASAISRL